MSDARQDNRRECGGGAPTGVGSLLASGLARLSYAKVLATPALFVALGGTATAVVTPPRVLDAADEADVVPACGEGGDLAACTNRLSILLPAGSWLVQGKLVISQSAGLGSGGSLCGLVRGDGTTLDEVPVVRATADGEVVALTGVLSGVPDDTRVGLRCREGLTEDFELAQLRMTALEVRPVSGP